MTVTATAMRRARKWVAGTVGGAMLCAGAAGVSMGADGKGELGARVPGWVPVIGQTYLGNQRGLVQFRRTAGTLAPNLAMFDRYLALYSKYCGAPRIVTLYLWEMSLAESKGNVGATLSVGWTDRSGQKHAVDAVLKDVQRLELSGPK